MKILEYLERTITTAQQRHVRPAFAVPLIPRKPDTDGNAINLRDELRAIQTGHLVVR